MKALDYSIEGCLLDLQIFLKDIKLDALNSAITLHKTELVREILTEDKELVYHTDVDEWSPLHFCAARGTREIMKILIKEFDGDINQRANFSTPIQIADENGNLDCLITLIHKQVELRSGSWRNQEALTCLAEHEPRLQRLLDSYPGSDVVIKQENDHLKIMCKELVGDDCMQHSVEIF